MEREGPQEYEDHNGILGSYILQRFYHGTLSRWVYLQPLFDISPEIANTNFSLDGKTGLDPFRTLKDEGEPLKVHVKAYRNFHELLLKLDKDEMLTGYTKATVGYLAVKMYFDNKEKAKKQNDILWVTAQWFDQASEDIFRWRRAEVSNVWSQWRDDLGDRETELRRAREEHEQGDPGQLEKSLVAAREAMRVVLGRMLEEKRRVAAYRASQSTSE